MYTLSTCVDEIPPLFCQLDVLQRNQLGEFICWKEKARWIRFEEQAEQVLGRWSKPHVATIPQTAMEGLKELLTDAITILNLQIADTKEITECMIHAADEYLGCNYKNKLKLADILNLPHFHHHQKNMEKTLSQLNLLRLTQSSAALQDLIESKDGNKKGIDNIAMEGFTGSSDFKENTKFKRKVNRKAEGASVLVTPVDFVDSCKIIFVRFQAAASLPSFLEVNLASRFIVAVIGPVEKQPILYEMGRALSTAFADDLCRELFYAAQSKQDLLEAINHLSRNTVLIPPSEWDPKIRIEPPEKYLSKEQRKQVQEITDYIHDNQMSDESHGDPNLKAEKIPFAGLVADIRRKIPWIISDITDALNLQCIAATLYIYLVCLCSLVAFGALLGQNTENYMATIECILAGALCGVLFALFAGQPINILSATGPMLILENIIVVMCRKSGIDFLEFRLWIGIWIAVLLFLFVMFNLSFLVKFITRFTEDCFASLVALMFVIDAVKSLFNINKTHPAQLRGEIPKATNSCKCINTTIASYFLNSTNTSDISSNYDSGLLSFAKSSIDCLNLSGNWTCELTFKKYHPDVFFFSILLFILTFLICMVLKSFKDSSFFPTFIRQILSDFAVLIAILSMSILNGALGVQTPKLTVPSKLVPTRSDRGWFIPFFGKNQWYTILLAIIPAIIATLLVFMDQQITAVIVNRKEFKLKKSNGYHLDLLVVGVSIALCSILGLPWFVAATVLALAHVNALKVTSENSAPGEKPVFLGVREQRMTNLIMSILLGLSVFFTKILSYIPMPVLYAVFLYMGVSALGGLQVVDRILIVLMPAKYQPDYHFLRHVNTKRVHLYTLVQILSTGGMYLVKNIDAIAITFPLLVVATCGIRKLLDYVFSQRELYWLDNLLPGAKLEDDENKKYSCSSGILKCCSKGQTHEELPPDNDNEKNISL